MKIQLEDLLYLKSLSAMRRRFCLIWLVCLLSLILFSPAFAVDITVTNTNDSGAGSLRQAVLDVNASSDTTNTITFDAGLSGQTIKLTSDSLTLSKNVNITVPAGSTVTVSGNDALRIFNISSGVTVSMTNLTLTKGRANEGGAISMNSGTSLTLASCKFVANTSPNRGGAIYMNGGTVAITGGSFSDNWSNGNFSANGGGGAIFNNGGTLTIDATVFRGNQARYWGRGGAIYNTGATARLTVQNGALFDNNGKANPNNGNTFDSREGGAIHNDAGSTTDITDSQFINNIASDWGGALHNINGTMTVSRTQFKNNRAENRYIGGSSSTGRPTVAAGGALNTNGGVANFTDCLFDGNTAWTDGGAITAFTTPAIGTAPIAPGTLNIKNCVFTNNVANNGLDKNIFGRGGAICNTNTNVTIEGCSFSGNKARNQGGAISVLTGLTIINNSTVTGNSAINSGQAAIYNAYKLIMNGVTLANNQTAQELSDVAGTTTTLHNNIIWKSFGTNCQLLGTFAGSQTNLIGSGCASAALLSADPKLGILRNNGGPTETMALSADSPAIDKGVSNGLPTDQRGGSRPATVFCLGAYERQKANATATVDWLPLTAAPTGAKVSLTIAGVSIEMDGIPDICDSSSSVTYACETSSWNATWYGLPSGWTPADDSLTVGTLASPIADFKAESSRPDTANDATNYRVKMRPPLSSAAKVVLETGTPVSGVHGVTLTLAGASIDVTGTEGHCGLVTTDGAYACETSSWNVSWFGLPSGPHTLTASNHRPAGTTDVITAPATPSGTWIVKMAVASASARVDWGSATPGAAEVKLTLAGVSVTATGSDTEHCGTTIGSAKACEISPWNVVWYGLTSGFVNVLTESSILPAGYTATKSVPNPAKPNDWLVSMRPPESATATVKWHSLAGGGAEPTVTLTLAGVSIAMLGRPHCGDADGEAYACEIEGWEAVWYGLPSGFTNSLDASSIMPAEYTATTSVPNASTKPYDWLVDMNPPDVTAEVVWPSGGAPVSSKVKVQIGAVALTLDGTQGDCSAHGAGEPYVCETDPWIATWYALPSGWTNALVATPVSPSDYTATAHVPDANSPTVWQVDMRPPADASAKVDWSAAPGGVAPLSSEVKVLIGAATLTLDGALGDCSAHGAGEPYVCETAPWIATWYALPSGWTNALVATPVSPSDYTATAHVPNAGKPTAWLVKMRPPAVASAEVVWSPATAPAGAALNVKMGYAALDLAESTPVGTCSALAADGSFACKTGEWEISWYAMSTTAAPAATPVVNLTGYTATVSPSTPTRWVIAMRPPAMASAIVDWGLGGAPAGASLTLTVEYIAIDLDGSAPGSCVGGPGAFGCKTATGWKAEWYQLSAGAKTLTVAAVPTGYAAQVSEITTNHWNVKMIKSSDSVLASAIVDWSAAPGGVAPSGASLTLTVESVGVVLDGSAPGSCVGGTGAFGCKTEAWKAEWYQLSAGEKTLTVAAVPTGYAAQVSEITTNHWKVKMIKSSDSVLASAIVDWSAAPGGVAPSGAQIKTQIGTAALALDGVAGDCSLPDANGSFACESVPWKAEWFILPSGWVNALTAIPLIPADYTATASRPDIATKPTEWLVKMRPPMQASARVFWNPSTPPANGKVKLNVIATNPLDPAQTKDALIELDGVAGDCVAAGSHGQYACEIEAWEAGWFGFPADWTKTLTASDYPPEYISEIVSISNVNPYQWAVTLTRSEGIPSISAAVSSDKVGLTLTDGDEIRYTFTLTNSGNGAASNVTLRVPVPVGSTYVSAEPAAGIHYNGTRADYLQWNAGSIPAGVTKTYCYLAKVNANARSEADRLRVFAMFDQGNAVPIAIDGENPGGVTPQLENPLEGTPPAFPLVHVEITSDKPYAYISPGETLTYTLIATNSGGAAANNVALRGFIPAGTSYVDGSASVGGTPHLTSVIGVDRLYDGKALCMTHNKFGGARFQMQGGAGNSSTSYVQWNLSALPAGGTETTSYEVKIALTSADTQSYILNVGAYNNGGAAPLPIDAPNPEMATNPSNNPFDPSGVALGAPWVSVSMSSDKMRKEVEGGEGIAYKLIAMNSGTASTDNVFLRDYIPAGTEYILGSASVGGQSGTSGKGDFLQWSIDHLSPGASKVFAFSALVKNGLAHGTRINNIVNFDEGGTTPPTMFDPDPALNSNLLTNLVRAPSDGGGGGGGGGSGGSDGDRDSDSSGRKTLPKTGFPMGRLSSPGARPARAQLSGLTLEIPALSLSLPIVGVPLGENGDWDISWLTDEAGWLEGSAYPTWNGNTVLTAHVWDADNQPGPFAHLKELRYGDRVKIEAVDGVYVFEIRSNEIIYDTDVKKMMAHEKRNWLTLMTCEGYDATRGSYIARRMARAVLVAKE